MVIKASKSALRAGSQARPPFASRLGGTPRRVAAARFARQRTPRTAAEPRVPSELIAATIIQLNHIHYLISG